MTLRFLAGDNTQSPYFDNIGTRSTILCKPLEDMCDWIASQNEHPSQLDFDFQFKDRDLDLKSMS
ncbi:uncharacterized protein N7503_003195 [Penicillium pulvis]|uniref:uncharacterized protein n=1 Tax=Penicillium pulvis TaxID=1562058 RepID=UPI0025477A42|nr:uncharacterized protein N7503_003195 [Penicillium pulvis]KAJ5805593.1 hypothetical protein N7503_003195 [Penicillium pulvis]